MAEKYKVVYSTDPEPEPKKGAEEKKKAPPAKQQTVYVERDRKGRGGKTVTVISGLPENPATKEKMLKQFKTLCGAGGTLKDGVLEIQGDHRDKLLDKLKAMGYQVKQKGG
jgi:translation initiation factor 1